MPHPQSKKSKRYCFIINNASPTVETMLRSFKAKHCKYLVYCRFSEINHLQGFFTLEEKLSVTGVYAAMELSPTDDPNLPVKGWMQHRYFRAQLYLEAAKAKSAHLVAIYKKNGNYIEFGTTPYPGKRNDLSDHPPQPHPPNDNDDKILKMVQIA
jgi:hypothetical protein